MDQAKRPNKMPKQDLRNRYLAMLSHDLKSALTGVIGGLRQIESISLGDKDLKHRDGALASAVEASRLLDGILDIEAIETGRFELNIEATNIESFLSEIHRRWSARAEWKDLTLKVYMEGKLPKVVDLDRGRLSRVLGNLIDNSIKNTEEGTIELSVHLKDEKHLVFTVSDEGSGFSEEALDSLFQFRGRPENSDKPGSGLGLYISQSLLEQMQSQIRIRNLPERGAEAVVVAKIDTPDADETGSAAASVSVFPSTKLPDLSGLHILLAEDNMTNQLVVTQMLDAMGAKFSVASDGVEALAKFGQANFEVLLLDIEMPRLSGLDVIRTIRSRTDKRRSQTIIALTAYAMREHRERIAAAGADGLIAKPILGIEDFGISILNTFKKTTATDSAGIQSKAESEPTGEGLVDETIYQSLERSIGSKTMVELLTKVEDDLCNVKDGITSGLEASDKRMVGAASHILISVAGAIGALTTQYDAQALNKATHDGDWSVIRLHAVSCLTKIKELIKFVESRLLQ